MLVGSSLVNNEILVHPRLDLVYVASEKTNTRLTIQMFEKVLRKQFIPFYSHLWAGP